MKLQKPLGIGAIIGATVIVLFCYSTGNNDGRKVNFIFVKDLAVEIFQCRELIDGKYKFPDKIDLNDYSAFNHLKDSKKKEIKNDFSTKTLIYEGGNSEDNSLLKWSKNDYTIVAGKDMTIELLPTKP